MNPRIYTYKVTFEEIPDWYWGVHKEKRFGEEYLGSPVTNRWKWEFYTPKLQVLEEFPYSEKGWEEANLVEDRLIAPDLNNPLCLNESCGGKSSLRARRQGGVTTVNNNRERGEGLHSLSADDLSNNGKKGARKGHERKDEDGKSVHAKKMNRKSHEVKTADGKSAHAVNCGVAASKVLYQDPDHPELGVTRACSLVIMQKKRGYPHGPENRVKA
jgi:hypothetical protein